MFIITAEFTVKPENREAIINLTRNLVEQTLLEEGCISYSFFEDLHNPNKFMFFERWKTKEAIDIHFEKPYVKSFGATYSSLKVGPTDLKIQEIKDSNDV